MFVNETILSHISTLKWSPFSWEIVRYVIIFAIVMWMSFKCYTLGGYFGLIRWCCDLLVIMTITIRCRSLVRKPSVHNKWNALSCLDRKWLIPNSGLCPLTPVNPLPLAAAGSSSFHWKKSGVDWNRYENHPISQLKNYAYLDENMSYPIQPISHYAAAYKLTIHKFYLAVAQDRHKPTGESGHVSLFIRSYACAAKNIRKAPLVIRNLSWDTQPLVSPIIIHFPNVSNNQTISTCHAFTPVKYFHFEIPTWTCMRGDAFI